MILYIMRIREMMDTYRDICDNCNVRFISYYNGERNLCNKCHTAADTVYVEMPEGYQKHRSMRYKKIWLGDIVLPYTGVVALDSDVPAERLAELLQKYVDDRKVVNGKYLDYGVVVSEQIVTIPFDAGYSHDAPTRRVIADVIGNMSVDDFVSLCKIPIGQYMDMPFGKFVTYFSLISGAPSSKR